jgi:hypothetical protein
MRSHVGGSSAGQIKLRPADPAPATLLHGQIEGRPAGPAPATLLHGQIEGRPAHGLHRRHRRRVEMCFLEVPCSGRTTAVFGQGRGRRCWLVAGRRCLSVALAGGRGMTAAAPADDHMSSALTWPETAARGRRAFFYIIGIRN